VSGPWGAFVYIAWCGIIQLAVGWPFLTTHPVAYVTKAFELGRVFMFKWTVNWKFLDPEVGGPLARGFSAIVGGFLGTGRFMAQGCDLAVTFRCSRYQGCRCDGDVTAL
jgi:hypothetical protein